MKRNLKLWGAVATALSTACVSANAAPETLALEVRAGAGYSDNVQRTSTDELSSAAISFGGSIDYAEKTQRLDASVAGDLDYVFYEADGTDDELVGNFDTRIRFGIVPETFTWVIDQSYGQGRVSLFQASGPQNREGINYLSTGPDLLLRLSSRDYLQLFARYSNAWYEESDSDNDQFGGGVTVGRQIDQDTSLSLTGNYSRTKYDLDTIPEIDSAQVFASYISAGARTTTKLDLGYRTIDSGDGSEGGPLVRARVERKLTESASIFGFANYQYDDRASSLSGDLSRPGVPPSNDVYAGGGLFEELAVGAGGRYVRLRTTLSASLSYREQDYLESDQNDVDRIEAALGVERQLGQRYSVGARVRLWREDVTEIEGDNRETMGALFARWESPRTFGVQGEWQYWDGNSDFGDAQENRFWLRLTWQPVNRGDGS